ALDGLSGICAVSVVFFFSSRRRHTRSTRDWSSDVCSSDLLLETQPSGAPVPFVLERGSPRVVIHTSGTTGSPKPASRRLGETGTRSLMGLLSVIPYRRSDVVLCPAPLFHSFGLLSFSLVALLGATIVLPERFEPEESLALMEEDSVTAASFVPVMVRRILSRPPEA